MGGKLSKGKSPGESTGGKKATPQKQPAQPVAVAGPKSKVEADAPLVPSTDEFSGLSNDTKLTMEDFSILKVLGKGAFGKVMLVKKKDDKKSTLYALKTLRKAEIVKRGQVDHTKTERIVLEKISCPFLIHLVYAFQTTEKLYMVLEYSGGGELFFWIKKQHRFSESRARLYAAEVYLAVAAMHKENIIHRDLKVKSSAY